MIVSYCFTSEVQFFETKSEMSETGNPGTPEFDLATAENRMRQPQSDPWLLKSGAGKADGNTP